MPSPERDADAARPVPGELMNPLRVILAGLLGGVAGAAVGIVACVIPGATLVETWGVTLAVAVAIGVYFGRG